MRPQTAAVESRRHRSLAGLLALAVAAPLIAILVAGPAVSAPGELLISEYVEGSSNNKAIELYNGTGAPIDLAAGGYTLEFSFNGVVAPGTTIALAGTVAAGDVWVVADDSANATILAVTDQQSTASFYNGDDAIVLRTAGAVVDSFGQVGFDPGTEWGTGIVSTQDNTLRRMASVEAGDTNPSDVFTPATQWDGFAVDTFAGLGAHSTSGGGGDALPTLTCGGALSVLQGSSASRPISAVDTDDAVTSLAITSAPVAGITLGSVVPAGASGGTATANLDVSDTTAPGTYPVTITATNDDVVTPQSATCTISVRVVAIVPIGTVQGAVADGANGATHASPFASLAPPANEVVVQGVVTQRTLARSTGGGLQNGFFLQDAGDANPQTSDGIFVFIGASTTIGGGYTPTVGDEIVLSGRVTEFFNLTELVSTSLVQVVRSGVDLDTERPAFDADPPAGIADAARYWERTEGMRSRVVADSVVLGHRSEFPSTADAEVWVAHPASTVATAADPAAQRSFRDAHPLDDDPALVDNGNGYRILMGSLGIKATAGDSLALIAPVRTFDRMAAPVVGGVYFSFSKYSVQPSSQPVLVRGLDPSTIAPPVAATGGEYAVATFNVENLYDFRNDPTDGCDFTGDAGCPGVSPPFNYVPASALEYGDRVAVLAGQIVTDLRSPDVIAVQEAEDQDICSIVAGAVDCSAGDGRPDTLQELALSIVAAGGPVYDAAADRDGADARGIISGFLFRTDRVELLPASPADAVLGSAPTVAYRSGGLAYNTQVSNPKALNAPLPGDVDISTGVDGANVFTRAPQVALMRIWKGTVGSGPSSDVYVISNHFSSVPDQRVGQRTEQAAYNAAIVTALQGADANVGVVVGGDLNVYPRPDDPFPTAPSDQLGPLYTAGLTNLYDVLLADVPAAAYSYVFDGQTQTLDQLFVTPSLLAEVTRVRAAHVNADWTAGISPATRAASDHDPWVATFAAPVAGDSLSIGDVTVTETRARGDWAAARIPLVLSNAQAGPVVVAYTTMLGGSATAGPDYEPRTGSITIPAGRLTGEIVVFVKGDLLPEPDEVVNVGIVTASGDVDVVDDDFGVITIRNAGPPPPGAVATPSTVVVPEPDAASGIVWLPVTIQVKSAVPVVVNYATAPGTARSPSDFLPRTGSVTVPAGASSFKVSVYVRGDVVVEPDEVFTVSLTGGFTYPSGSQIVVTIRNDANG